MKTCTKCGAEKPETEFWKKSSCRSGLDSRCKECARKQVRGWYAANKDRMIAKAAKWRYEHRERNRILQKKWRDRHRTNTHAYHLKTTYGIGVDAFKSFLISQGSACAICGTKTPRGKGFHVDHDHKTGSIRGILCQYCNHLLGNAHDDPEILEAAAIYLRKFTTKRAGEAI